MCFDEVFYLLLFLTIILAHISLFRTESAQIGKRKEKKRKSSATDTCAAVSMAAQRVHAYPTRVHRPNQRTRLPRKRYT